MDSKQGAYGSILALVLFLFLSLHLLAYTYPKENEATSHFLILQSLQVKFFNFLLVDL